MLIEQLFNHRGPLDHPLLVDSINIASGRHRLLAKKHIIEFRLIFLAQLDDISLFKVEP